MSAPIKIDDDLQDENSKLRALISNNFGRRKNDPIKDRKALATYVELKGYKNGENQWGCQNGTPKSSLEDIAKELNMFKRNLQRALRIERNLTDSMKELLDTGEIIELPISMFFMKIYMLWFSLYLRKDVFLFCRGEKLMFHECSHYIYNWISRQKHVKEESVTDWLLYEISQRCNFIFYQTYSRHEEARNGSDWEWWVLTSGNKRSNNFSAFRFLVQAKKLIPNGMDNYSLINYGNKYGTQIDLLLKAAKNKRAFPLYMFYSIGKPDILEQKKNMQSYRDLLMNNQHEYQDDGCFLSSAFNIYSLLYQTARKIVYDYQILNYSIELSILDFIFESQTKDLDRYFTLLNYKLENRKYMLTNTNYSIDGNKYTKRSIPNYLKVFIETKENINWLDNESELKDISGLGIIDLRRIEN